MTRRTLFALASIPLALACGRDKTTGDDTGSGGAGGGDGGGGTSDECTTDEGCADWEICEGGTCQDGDRNNSSDDAETILWEEFVTGYINPEEDVDWYTFEADGGEFVRIWTAHDFDSGDTVLTLRRANGKVVAVADDYANGWSVTSRDSVIFAYLAEAGSYTVSVEDIGTYYGTDDAVGDPDYAYELMLEEWDSNTRETDAFDDPNATAEVEDDFVIYTFGALLEEEGDQDYVAVDLSAEGAALYLDGNQDMDGSDAVSRVRLLDASGQVLTDKTNVGPDDHALYPTTPPGDYVVELSDADGGGGPNHWLFLHVIAYTSDPPFESEVEPDDTLGLATTLALEEYENSSGQLWSRAKGEGFVDAGDEADWFAFEAPYEESWITVCLNSELWGSAMVPSIAVTEDDGDTLDSAEGASGSPNANIENVELSEGTFYIALTPPDGAAGGPDSWYRFYVYVTSFQVNAYEDGGYGCP